MDVEKNRYDKLKNAPDNLKNLKSKVDKLDFDKLVLVTVHLSKLSDVVKNDVIKKDPSKHLLVFKTSWRRLEDISWRRLQDVFKTCLGGKQNFYW